MLILTLIVFSILVLGFLGLQTSGTRVRSRGQAAIDDAALQAAGQRTATTADGRRVAYMHYGSDDPGAPVFLNIHGSGLECGFEATVYSDASRQLGVRAYAISLPGYGFTDQKPGRVVRDWPHEDLAAVLVAEGIDTFYITGHSQGTPHAIAAAMSYPERCLGLGLNAPLLPSALVDELGLEKTIGTAHTPNTAMLSKPMMGWYFGMMNLLMGVLPPSLLSSPIYKGPPKVKADYDLMDRFQASMRDTTVRGTVGGIWETAQDVCFDWGLDIQQLQHPNAAVWHADDDNAIPAGQGKWLAEHLGADYCHQAEGYGHMTYTRGRYRTAAQSLIARLLQGTASTDAGPDPAGISPLRRQKSGA